MSSPVGALPPPPGVTPDFRHPYSIRKFNVVTQAVCLPIVTFCVLARVYTKARITNPLGPEDYTCVAAWMGLITYGVLSLHNDTYGNGVHEWDVTVSDVIRWAQFENVQEIIYGPIILITKISILLLYTNLFAPIRKSTIRILIQVLLYFNVLYYTAITFVKIFECTPRRKIWERMTPGRCINFYALLYTTGLFNLCSDLAILVLPINVIWNLHMPTRRKVGISAAFAAGFLAPLATILRLVASARGGASPDATYSLFSVALWTEAEITIGIICSCIPALPALFRHLFPNKLSQSTFTGTRKRYASDDRSGRRSVFPSRAMISSSSRQRNPDDMSFSREEYWELRSGRMDGQTCIGGTVTNIKGGESPGVTASDLGLEAGEGGRENAIVKTVRMETYPQPLQPILGRDAMRF